MSHGIFVSWHHARQALFLWLTFPAFCVALGGVMLPAMPGEGAACAVLARGLYVFLDRLLTLLFHSLMNPHFEELRE
jgi:hypothetical protein